MSILTFLLLSLVKVAVVTVVLLLAVAYTVLLERKLVARIQNRWGPSRVGPFGLLQPLVDGAKSFLKEDIIPSARLSAALYSCADYFAELRAAFDCGGSVRTRDSLSRSGSVSDFGSEHWAAGDPRRDVGRRLRDCAVGVVVEQQVFAAGIAAGDRPGDQL